MKVVPVRLDDKMLKSIDLLVKAGVYKNRSEALRKIVGIGMSKVEVEVEYLKRIDGVVDKIIDLKLDFGGVLRRSLEEGRDRW